MTLKLIHKSICEAEHTDEVQLRKAYRLLEEKLKPPFDLAIPTRQEYFNLNKAIIYGVLCQPHLARVHITHLHGIVTDGYAFFTITLVKIVHELYSKLAESARVQLIWLSNEMVNVSAVGFDALLVSLLRQIVSGDFSEGNLWLCTEVVNLFCAKWHILLEEEPLLITGALYTFLRLLADHSRVLNDSRLELLKRLEIGFCVRVLREQFHLCLKIGRDLVRLLQDVFHIPEFRAVWKILILNPTEFATHGFSDISQLYRSRTSSWYFLLRITPKMETELLFMLTHVKLGSQKRYQIWFAKKYFNVPERETLVIDIVRFICCAHHPPNETIQSDIIPRWAVIGWLLKICRKSYVEANVKLALLYDWLFYNEKVDSVMNIEPAILLMVNSIPKYVDITHNLLEYLFILADKYDGERHDLIVQGVSLAFDTLIRKCVIQSYDVLTSCDLLDPSLRERLEGFIARP